MSLNSIFVNSSVSISRRRQPTVLPPDDSQTNNETATPIHRPRRAVPVSRSSSRPRRRTSSGPPNARHHETASVTPRRGAKIKKQRTGHAQYDAINRSKPSDIAECSPSLAPHFALEYTHYEYTPPEYTHPEYTFREYTLREYTLAEYTASSTLCRSTLSASTL